jgi:cobalt-zinc-cadmium efflux system membrane fusion protein
MNRRKLPSTLLNAVMALVFVALAGGIGIYIYVDWRARQAESVKKEDAAPKPALGSDGVTPVRLSKEAQKNLGLKSAALKTVTYWRKIDIPGVITDRPGVSDRGVVAPITGIVTAIHAYPGDVVAPNSPLFTLRLISETLHASQLELYKATNEIEIARQHRQRLEGVTGIAGVRLIELDNQIQRMEVNVQAYRQDLIARGLPLDRIDAAARGEFVTEIMVRAPDEKALQVAEVALTSGVEGEHVEPKRLPFSFELQKLDVELGQQVDAGQVLCSLADHRVLQIEGCGFKKDMPLVQRAAKDRLPIEVAFELDEGAGWPPLPDQLPIRHVANVIDVETRTFAFYLPLENQWQSYTHTGGDELIWRFRPGDRVWLSVAVERIDDVFVLPKAALVREGPEAFVFRQNGDLFDRMPVHVLHEDNTSVVLANDGRLRPGFFIAQNSAASLNRVLKAQLSSGQPANLHVHPDGTVHAAH